MTLFDIHFQYLVDNVRHVFAEKRGTQNLAKGGIVGGIASNRDLIIFLAFLVDAQDADVAAVVVAAAVDAAADVERDVADVVLQVQVLEALMDGRGDGDGSERRS